MACWLIDDGTTRLVVDVAQGSVELPMSRAWDLAAGVFDLIDAAGDASAAARADR
ncbi:MAG: hypothetical protein ACRC35_03170 [Angustibacter sp.]